MNNIALIIAHNEEATIERVVKDLLKVKQEGVISRVVLVNDGSTDSTAKIASKLNIEIINLSRNVGKGQAFIEGVNFCAKHDADNVLTFDGDLLEVKTKQVKKLLQPLKNKNVKMVLGTVREDGTALSGQRAIRMSALKPLYQAKNKNWIKHMQGFGLEATLNHYLGMKTIFLPKLFDRFGGSVYNGWHPFLRNVKYAKTNFHALPANKRGLNVTQEAVQKRFELIEREIKARNLKKIRKLKSKGKNKEQIKSIMRKRF